MPCVTCRDRACFSLNIFSKAALDVEEYLKPTLLVLAFAVDVEAIEAPKSLTEILEVSAF